MSMMRMKRRMKLKDEDRGEKSENDDEGAENNENEADDENEDEAEDGSEDEDTHKPKRKVSLVKMS